MTARRSGPLSVDVILFMTVLLAAGWFSHAAPGWNVNSRLALTRAITEHGALSIDRVLAADPAMETGDTASLRGKTYSDKTPGASFVAIPAALVVRGVESLTGPISTPVRRYWITWGSCGLALAVFAVLMSRLVRALIGEGGTGERTQPSMRMVPFFTGLITALATPAFYYGSLLMSYAPMLALITGAALLILRAIPLGDGAGGVSGGESAVGKVDWYPGWLLLAGLLLGLALLMEYIAGLACAALGLWAWMRVFVAGGAGMAGRLLAVPLLMISGAVVGWSPFAFYANAAFGQVAIPYAFHSNEMFRVYMARGFMGVNAPNPTVAWLITFHPYRGLFIQAPWLGLGLIWGGVMVLAGMLRGAGTVDQPGQEADEAHVPPVAEAESAHPAVADPGAQLWVLGSLAAAMAYILFNSGYYMWWGGWSFAPRHLVPLIPFAAATAALCWVLAGRVWRGLLIAGVAWAVLIQWTVMATDPQTPDIGRAGGTTLPRLLEPRLGSVPPWPWTRQVLPRMNAGATSYAYGREALRGWTGLVPLLVLVSLAGWLASRRAREQEKNGVDPGNTSTQ